MACCQRSSCASSTVKSVRASRRGTGMPDSCSHCSHLRLQNSEVILAVRMSFGDQSLYLAQGQDGSKRQQPRYVAPFALPQVEPYEVPLFLF